MTLTILILSIGVISVLMIALMAILIYGDNFEMPEFIDPMNEGIRKVEQLPTDWIAGDIPHQDLKVKWGDYLSDPEVQYDPRFDSMGCASFSLTNVIETQLNYHLAQGNFSKPILNLYNSMGVIQNDKFNFSDRFVVVGSGTTESGNTMQKVIDFVRKNGFVSEGAWPFSQTMTHDDFFTSIPQEIYAKAKKIKWTMNIAYEWSITEQTKQQDRLSLAQNALQHAPLWFAIPICPTYKESVALTCPMTTPQHCVECYGIDTTYQICDQYNPFLKKLALDYPVLWAMKVVVTPRNPITLTRNLFFGCSGDDVKTLQTFLGVNPTGFFGSQTYSKVIEYQTDMGISPIGGYVGKLTRASLSGYPQHL